MRLAILADGRSAITRGWLSTLIERDIQVHLLSTFPCTLDMPLSSQHLVPIAFSGMAKTQPEAGGRAPGGAAAIHLRAVVRRWLGIATFPAAIRRLRGVLERLDVDMLHALRIPFEGMLAAESNPAIPMILSVWGNDFTLHAQSTPWMRGLTRRALRRADGLHADCERDIRIARGCGLDSGLPTLVVPGNGGLDRSVFPGSLAGVERQTSSIDDLLASLSADTPVVVNPRGFRAYVRNDTFFQSVPLILREIPNAMFLVPAMLGERPAQKWLKQFGIEDAVILLPRLKATEMAAIYKRSQVMVSPSEHDGTPNTFLEAIACGSFPVASDLESLREWIDDGVNGYLFNPASPAELAARVINALRDPGLRDRAYEHNQRLVSDRAERASVGSEIEGFYSEVLSRWRH